MDIILVCWHTINYSESKLTQIVLKDKKQTMASLILKLQYLNRIAENVIS